MGTMEVVKPVLAAGVEQVLIGGDLSKLTPEQRLSYYNATCASLGLNPLTKPFAYISLNGKLTMYALKDCTDQLRTVHGISLAISSREVLEGVYVVTAKAVRVDGRYDESTGAVPIDKLQGESRANAMMKAETKAKRRVTLSICGLGMLDESETASIAGARQEQTEDHAELVQRRIEETKGGADVIKPESDNGAGAVTHDQPPAPLQAEAAAISEDVPVPLRIAFQTLTKAGGAREALRLLKDKLAAAMPEMGGAEYRRIVEKHGLGNGGMKVVAVKAALLEMWQVAEFAEKQKASLAPAYAGVNDDIPF